MIIRAVRVFKKALSWVMIFFFFLFQVHLIEGIIDQVDETVYVSWVQPRVLGIPQIKALRERLDGWLEKVHTTLLTVEAETPDLVVSWWYRAFLQRTLLNRIDSGYKCFISLIGSGLFYLCNVLSDIEMFILLNEFHQSLEDWTREDIFGSVNLWNIVLSY